MMKANNTAVRPLPRLSAQDPPFATILVGPDKKRFVVHRDLLTYHSTFFKAALTGNFKEAESKTVTLQEVDPLIFEFFVHWLYHKTFPVKDNAPVELLNEWEAEDNDSIKTYNLIHLHVLGDQCGLEGLKLLTMKEFFLFMAEDFTFLPSDRQVSYAYENLPTGSAFLRYLVDMWCFYAEETAWEDDKARKFPSPFLFAVLRRYNHYALGEPDICEGLVLCDYHNHISIAEEEKCPSKGVISS